MTERPISPSATIHTATRAPDQRTEEEEGMAGLRGGILRGFAGLEDIVYIGLGVLLGASAIVLLADSAISFVQELLSHTLATNIVDHLDRMLFILMIAEILYTVQVSFRSHVLRPEPFLIVGLIAATRRILVLTAEFAKLLTGNADQFRESMLELGLLTIMIVALVISLYFLRRRPPTLGADPGAVRLHND